MSERVPIRKTYKLYIGGKFPRSESGRSYEVTDSKGHFLANPALATTASRASLREARQAFASGSPLAELMA